MDKSKKAEENDRFRLAFCCGSFHVETGALFFATMLVLMSVARIIQEMGKPEEPKMAYMVGLALTIVVCMAVIFAKQFRCPVLYLPYLVYMGFNIIIMAGLTILCVCYSVYTAYYNSTASTHPSAKELLIIAAFTAINAVGHAWVWHVVKLAREFGKIQREVEREKERIDV